MSEPIEDATIRVAAALAAAISLLERSPKTAAPSDKIFDMMVSDYKRALEAWRAAIRLAEAERERDAWIKAARTMSDEVERLRAELAKENSNER